uniref:Uncharacterized protein n=1 Tax=Rhizophora mucronata TaxID=61149 RepID=A0A2P2J029_RHIMU
MPERYALTVTNKMLSINGIAI